MLCFSSPYDVIFLCHHMMSFAYVIKWCHPYDIIHMRSSHDVIHIISSSMMSHNLCHPWHHKLFIQFCSFLFYLTHALWCVLISFHAFHQPIQSCQNPGQVASLASTHMNIFITCLLMCLTLLPLISSTNQNPPHPGTSGSLISTYFLSSSLYIYMCNI